MDKRNKELNEDPRFKNGAVLEGFLVRDGKRQRTETVVDENGKVSHVSLMTKKEG